eukprot:gene58000-79450_t
MADTVLGRTQAAGLGQRGSKTHLILPIKRRPDQAHDQVAECEARQKNVDHVSKAARGLAQKPGNAARVGDVIVRLAACEQTAPWEQEHYTGAFVQVDVQQFDKSWRRFFSGWLYKERPTLNVVQHPIYDVWVKSCAMTFPEGGPGSVSANGLSGSGAATPSRSSAKKSPELAPPDVTPAAVPTTPSSAPPS